MKLELLHLNHDSSWLLTYTPSDRARPPFNLVIDPWLAGAQYDIHPSFSRQTHILKPHISSLSELEIILANRTPPQTIDAILISHPFTDHCHLQTLQTLSPACQAPIFVGTEKIRAVLRDTRFEHHCHVIPLFKTEASADFLQIRLKDLISHNRTASLPQDGDRKLADDLHMMYIPTSNRLDMTGIHLHGSIVIAVDGCSDSPTAQSIIYSPHGMPSRSHNGFLQRYQDRLHVVALMQSFQRSTNPWFLAGKITFGHKSAMKLCRLLKTNHLICTHDDVKDLTGFISKVIEIHRPTNEEVQQLALINQVRVSWVASGDMITL